MSAGQLARSRLVGDRPTLTLRPPWAKWRFFAAGAATTRLARDAVAPQGTQGLLWRPGTKASSRPQKGSRLRGQGHFTASAKRLRAEHRRLKRRTATSRTVSSLATEEQSFIEHVETAAGRPRGKVGACRPRPILDRPTRPRQGQSQTRRRRAAGDIRRAAGTPGCSASCVATST